MKLTVMTIILVAAISASAVAQVPFVHVYFDESLTMDDKNCPVAPAGTVIDTAWVGLKGFQNYLGAIAYTIDYPASMQWLGDSAPGALILGQSNTEISIAWGNDPQIGYGNDIVVQRIVFVWQCSGCGASNDDPVTVVPHASLGVIEARTWPTNEAVSLYNAGSANVCRTVPVIEETFGAIKSLYQ